MTNTEWDTFDWIHEDEETHVIYHHKILRGSRNGIAFQIPIFEHQLEDDNAWRDARLLIEQCISRTEAEKATIR